MTKPVCLALQGGGAHGAFTWGVLDSLLGENDLSIGAVSGTSAGAMNAAALSCGMATGGQAGAREALDRLWRLVSQRSPLEAAETALPFMPFVPPTVMRQMLERMKLFGQLVSPYHPALPAANALRRVVEEAIDFETLRGPQAMPTFVSATEVESGRARIFTGAELTADALLASACLPDLFRAVEIDGKAYWDGGYMGNPVLTPLFADECECEDLLIVQVTPFERSETPERPADIIARVSEITFNSSLMRDLRTIAEIQKLAEGEEAFESPRLRRIAKLRVHMITAGAELTRRGAASKLDTRLSALQDLRELGRAAAARWLETHRGDVGRCSTAASTLESFT